MYHVPGPTPTHWKVLMERQTTSIIILLWDYSETALATTKQCTAPTPDLVNTQTTPLFLGLLQDYFETTPSPIL